MNLEVFYYCNKQQCLPISKSIQNILWSTLAIPKLPKYKLSHNTCTTNHANQNLINSRPLITQCSYYSDGKRFCVTMCSLKRGEVGGGNSPMVSMDVMGYLWMSPAIYGGSIDMCGHQQLSLIFLDPWSPLNYCGMGHTQKIMTIHRPVELIPHSKKTKEFVSGSKHI